MNYNAFRINLHCSIRLLLLFNNQDEAKNSMKKYHKTLGIKKCMSGWIAIQYALMCWINDNKLKV